MINNVVLVGRMTRDAELALYPIKCSSCDFYLAVNRTFKSQNGEREADFINVVIWRQQAENLANWAKKALLSGLQVAFKLVVTKPARTTCLRNRSRS